MARIDVIVPCYNYGGYLRGCVRSVLTQEQVEPRVLILDDASSDQTPQVGATLAGEDPRVEFRRHSSNRGHIATYNEGIEWLDAEYALLLSADDQLTSGSLHRAISVMEAHPEVAMAYGRAIRTSCPERYHVEAAGAWQFRIVAGRQFVEELAGENVVPTPTAVVRGPLQKELGGYRADLPHAGDLEMWLRFAAHGSIAFIDADQAFYRVHSSNMMHQYVGTRDLLQRKAAYEVLFQEHGHHLGDANRIRRWTWGRMAREAYWHANSAFDRGEVSHCRQWLDVALEIEPRLWLWSAWWRLRIKRLLGPRLWSAIRPMANRLRSAGHRGRALDGARAGLASAALSEAHRS